MGLLDYYASSNKCGPRHVTFNLPNEHPRLPAIETKLPECPKVPQPENCPPNVNKEFVCPISPAHERSAEPQVCVKNSATVSESSPCKNSLPAIPQAAATVARPKESKESKDSVLCPQNLGKPGTEKSKCPARVDAFGPLSKPRLPDRIPAHQRLMDMLKEKEVEEEFHRDYPHWRRKANKYRGICGSLGNAVFTSTAMAPPAHTNAPPKTFVPGYPQPVKQHPQYRTTSGMFGERPPCRELTPISFHPKDKSFSTKQAVGGMYEDAHLTTELNSHPLW